MERYGFDISSKLLYINIGKVHGTSLKLGTGRLPSNTLNQCRKARHKFMKAEGAKHAQVESPEAVGVSIEIIAVIEQDMSGGYIRNGPFDITKDIL
ncbi:hypothetical protein VTN02DRAFT_2531 [Thermoascus thermophilus]